MRVVVGSFIRTDPLMKTILREYTISDHPLNVQILVLFSAGTICHVSAMLGDLRFLVLPHYGNQGDTPGSSICDADWKPLEFFDDGHNELYNIVEDIGETIDLSKQMPEKVAELSEKLRA
jgi:hypothetical protein